MACAQLMSSATQWQHVFNLNVTYKEALWYWVVLELVQKAMVKKP